MPAPSSSTLSSACSPSTRTMIVTAPRPCRRALSTRLDSARSSAARSPGRSPAPRSTRSAPAASGKLVEPHILVGRRRGLFPREREQVVGETGEPLGVGFQIGDSAGVAPWRARCATFPRSAVSGVRSSCEASARNRRSASRARSRLSSIALSVVASRPTSSAGVGSGNRLLGSPVRPISRRGTIEACQRPERPAHQQRRRGRTDAAASSAAMSVSP